MCIEIQDYMNAVIIIKLKIVILQLSAKTKSIYSTLAAEP